MDKIELNTLKLYLKSLPRLNDKTFEARIKRVKKDFRFFCKTYFNHHISLDEKSIFRNWVYESLPKISQTHNKIIIKAYRGAAKTTLISRLFLLWKTLNAMSSYSITISSTQDISKEGIDLIKTELEDNINLIHDFKISIAGVWSAEEIVFKIDSRLVKIKSFGANKKIRGTNFQSNRPDLIICDDIENDENVESKTQRDKLFKWFNKAILKLPSRLNPHYNIIVVGTTLHYDSLLSKIEKRQDFINFDFPLVLKFPSNLEFLNKNNLLNFKPLDMRLDDERIDKKDVLSDFLEDRASFYSEFQNQPFDKENAPLANYQTYESLPQGIDSITIGIDPSLGKKRGDYFGISRLFYHKLSKKMYWEASGFKLPPEAMIEKIINFYIQSKSICPTITIACEVVAFQEFFKTSLKSKFDSMGLFVPIVGIKNNQASKEVRLDSLSPLLKDESLVLYKHSHLLLEEADTYPKCPHDDLLDSGDIALQAFRNNSLSDYKIANKVSKSYAAKFQKIKEKY